MGGGKGGRFERPPFSSLHLPGVRVAGRHSPRGRISQPTASVRSASATKNSANQLPLTAKPAFWIYIYGGLGLTILGYFLLAVPVLVLLTRLLAPFRLTIAGMLGNMVIHAERFEAATTAPPLLRP